MPRLQLEPQPEVSAYLERLRTELKEVPVEERERLVDHARARIELDLELAGDPAGGTDLASVLDNLGAPASLAQRLRSQAPLVEAQEEAPSYRGRLTACRSCRKEVSVEANACPHCGAPWPARQGWRGYGYEWKSKQTLFGLPLVHVAFGRNANGKLRVAKGIVAVGQFAIGAVTVAQFGVGAVLGIGQFVIAPLALGQFAFGLLAAGQFGIGILAGAGMFATGIVAKGMATFGNFFQGR
jgi:hypothetical protein